MYLSTLKCSKARCFSSMWSVSMCFTSSVCQYKQEFHRSTVSCIYSANGLCSRVSAAFSALNGWPGLSRALYPDAASVSEDHQIISFVGRLHFTCLLLPSVDLGSQPDGPLVGPLPPPLAALLVDCHCWRHQCHCPDNVLTLNPGDYKDVNH